MLTPKSGRLIETLFDVLLKRLTRYVRFAPNSNHKLQFDQYVGYDVDCA